jgi:hypothetical protein
MRISPRACLSAVAFTGSMFAVLLAFASAARADYTVNTCGPYPNDVYTAALPSDGSIYASSECPVNDQGSSIDLHASPTISASPGARGAWQANAPAGLEIVGASVSFSTYDNGGTWDIGAYWQGGSANLNTPLSGPPTLNGAWSGFASPYFGYQITCEANPCQAGTGGLVLAPLALTVRETSGPVLSAPNGLWQAAGWVRGQWPLNFAGDSPSGVCALSGTFDGVAVSGTSSPARDLATWHQCSAPSLSTTINTPAYGQGPVPLILSATDAAGNVGRLTKTINVDNSVPTLSLSGPIDASSTVGTQFVTATAGGSPSGIAEIACSVDGGSAQAYPGALVHVPVSGLGEHHVSCAAANNAVDANGVRGVSQTQTRSIKIGEPTALTVTFARFAGLRCKLEERPRRHRKLISVTKCNLARRIRVRHTRAAASRLNAEAIQHVRYGQATMVSGLLTRAGGAPLGGKTVKVLTAPDNGLGRFIPTAEVITAVNGTWTVSLPAGPSRLIEATYAGSETTERSESGQARLLVPAQVELESVTPAQVAWGQTVTIKGRLLGGYLPNAGINVRLRIGIANAKTTFGVKEHVAGTGNFTATFTFGVGDPSIHRTYWFQIASLPAGDYPYTPSASGRIYVQVGGHP